MDNRTWDLLIVGGGINGAGIARDAVGRGLSVLLVEQDDLAAHTSSASTKLIHGGLRYLEHYEFRLVSEALAEREVLLAIAPHLVEPLRFVLPHEPHLRPKWMIRAGLFLYDHLGGRRTLLRSGAVALDREGYGAGLKPSFRRGFVYSDARVDDARLVVANALDARARGADIRTRTRFAGARNVDGVWQATLAPRGGSSTEVHARVLVNAAGPWVASVVGDIAGARAEANVRHVKGSHIVVPRVHTADHAYILQNADRRIVFVIPYQDRYSLIGTTDIAVDSCAAPAIDAFETEYLLAIANAYLARSLDATDIVWSYSGVRPLYDDGASDPSAVTRDYVLKTEIVGGANGGGRVVSAADAAAPSASTGAAPLLSIYGGKITTYRRLAEHALADLARFLPGMKPAWTSRATLPGGDLPRGDRAAWLADLVRRYPQLDPGLLRAVAQRHGTRATAVLGDAKRVADLGEDFGASLTERELQWLVAEEWACDADDVLWRRTKCGLPMSAAQRERVAERLA
ncbi:MAG: glycerol-3-phosphate dehydrogenase [Proteobacteria bacterium]|jgi:glycerol-3-phosphate dehydrogenase|nr:glycerol-3-phosphate dehydrogenase [Pseudomonadota bacterium]